MSLCESLHYAIVIEKAEHNFAAYVPDLPGCVATAPTLETVKQEIRAAIAFHLDGLKADGQPIPAASSQVDYIDIPA